jgi:putative DNA topoisomerase
MSNSDNALFTRHENALQTADEICPDCGSAVTIKHGRSGTFLGCSNYPTCQYTRAVVEHERIADNVLVGSVCPICTSALAVKQGRYGMFIGCTNYPECHHVEETHHQDDVNVACPQCKKRGNNGELFEKTNRFGKAFYSCNNYPQCKYVLNYPPVAEECPLCHWSVMLKRKMASGNVIICPEKKCTYKRKAL